LDPLSPSFSVNPILLVNLETPSQTSQFDLSNIFREPLQSSFLPPSDFFLTGGASEISLGHELRSFFSSVSPSDALFRAFFDPASKVTPIFLMIFRVRSVGNLERLDFVSVEAEGRGSYPPS